MIAFLDLGDTLTWVAAGILVGVVVVIIVWYLWSIEWALTKKPVTGAESYVGKVGIAVRDFSSSDLGEVNIDGVIWRAMAKPLTDGTTSGTRISMGDPVVVIGVSSVTLLVKKKT